MLEILKLIDSLASHINLAGDIQSCINLVEGLIQLHSNVAASVASAVKSAAAPATNASKQG